MKRPNKRLGLGCSIWPFSRTFPSHSTVTTGCGTARHEMLRKIVKNSMASADGKCVNGTTAKPVRLNYLGSARPPAAAPSLRFRRGNGRRASLNVVAPSKARRLLPGESPGRVRASHPPVSSVGPAAERRKS